MVLPTVFSYKDQCYDVSWDGSFWLLFLVHNRKVLEPQQRVEGPLRGCRGLWRGAGVRSGLPVMLQGGWGSGGRRVEHEKGFCCGMEATRSCQGRTNAATVGMVLLPS